MPPKVALYGADAPQVSANRSPLARYPVQPKVVPLKSGLDAEKIFNCLNICFLRINPQLIITDINADALRWLQCADHDVVGRDFNSIFHGLGTHTLRDAIKTRSSMRCPLQSPHGKDRWVDLHIHPDSQGAIVFFNGTGGKRRPDRSADRTCVLLQASLNSLSAHVVVLDKTGTIVASNLAWQRFVATSRIPGLPIDRLSDYLSFYDSIQKHCPQARAIKESLAAVLSGRRRTMRQVYTLRELERVRWFELRATRLEREGHVVVLNDDVTAIKEVENALGEAAESLLSLQEEERERIAQELHDSTTQHLVAASLNLIGLRTRIDASGEAIEFLQRIEGSLSEASKELRSLTYLLHPPFLEADGLEETVRGYVEGFAKRTGLKPKLKIGRGVEALPFVLQRPVFRVIQEALANVHRHASASRVSIDLRCTLQHLHLVIRDNGRGMHSAKRQRLSEPSCLGVGIPGIRARLRQFGGRLVIKSGLRGTVLHAIVPINAETAGETASRPGTGNFSPAFGVSTDARNRTLQ